MRSPRLRLGDRFLYIRSDFDHNLKAVWQEEMRLFVQVFLNILLLHAVAFYGLMSLLFRRAIYET